MALPHAIVGRHEAAAFMEADPVGSVSMMMSLDRFITAHGEDIRRAALALLPRSISAEGPFIDLVNAAIRIEVVARWSLADGTVETLELRALDPYEAAEMDEQSYAGDCDMGW